MPALTALVTDDRSARVLLSIIGIPADVATGKLLAEVSSVELISIVDGDGLVPGMDRVEAAVWRDRILSAATPDRLAERIVEANKFRVIIPSDPDWPTSLNDLGARAPYAPELDHFSYPWLFPRLLRSSCVWALILGVAVICWPLISMVTSRKGRRVCTSFFKVVPVAA